MRPWQIAALRALAGGTVLGMSTFWGIFATTQELAPLLVAFNVPFWGVLAQRGVAEGWWDTFKS